ncbi:MAG: adenosylcobalamin-dependent ribonucleoside-diphosphate reductase [Candidatus Nitrosocaldus sp.]|nr:adenosylcobalamin-dependent ribonucleoside-diphosphate reductase [Candidatus Nitrosocaldus sp.]
MMDGTDTKPQDLASTIGKIRKRDGKVVEFQTTKITNAIYKALLATKRPDYALAERLAEKVVERLIKHGFNAGNIPGVEDVQDIVETVLIDEGLADTAKAYILYRHERRRIREEKMKILERSTLDEVDKALSTNSLRVLASRYLLRDESGKIVESPKQMFERVAILITIPDMLRDSRVFMLNGTFKRDDLAKVEHYLENLDGFDGRYSIGAYRMNKWHVESMLRLYRELASQGRMRVGIDEILSMLENREFDAYEKRVEEYYRLMVEMYFLPNSPTLMNAGARLGQLSACFVLPIHDDLASIMKTATDAALIFKSGGGVGINYSNLRPEGDIVASTSGVASGPVSFMRIVDTTTEVVKQGGKRRGANMGILEVWHPDIEKFITAKTKPGVLENFNVSVGVWSDFVDAVKGNEKYALRNPRNGKVVGYVDARQLIELIAISAWQSAEPGMLFLDNMNRYNVMKDVQGLIRATNPCGEQSLYPYESCNLGSINLAELVKRRADGSYEFDWQRYEQVIRLATRFLDNVIDVSKYPIDEIDRATKASRRIGLGIMGLADLLYMLRIPYNSKEGYELMNRLAEALTYYSMDESVEIAKSRGAFPLYNESGYVQGKLPVGGYYELAREEHTQDWDALIEKIKRYGIRNSQTTTVAPTGTLSMIADCSGGIEPTFALVYEKHVTVGKFYYTNRILEEVLKGMGMYSDELLQRIAENYGSVKGLDEVPEEVQRVFVTAMDIHWADHIMAQAVWQRWISNAIAKTINMPNDVTAEDVRCSYLLAHELGLKGITVFRDGSRQQQVLHITGESRVKRFDAVPSNYAIEYIRRYVKDGSLLKEIEAAILKGNRVKGSRGYALSTMGSEGEILCPLCKSRLVFAEGCNTCMNCGWSSCIVS